MSVGLAEDERNYVLLEATQEFLRHEMSGPTFGGPFHGAKIALLFEDKLVTILRDNKPEIDWPDYWDLPGGGREGNESAEACITREVMEELDILIEPKAIVWRRIYPSALPNRADSVFMVSPITGGQIESIRFGSEGQRWEMSPVGAFLENPRAVPHMKTRLADYLANLDTGWE